MLRKISDEEIHDLSFKAATIVVITLYVVSCAIFGAVGIAIALAILGL